MPDLLAAIATARSSRPPDLAQRWSLDLSSGAAGSARFIAPLALSIYGLCA